MKQGEERPFAVFDIDGTLVRWQLYHAVVNELIKQGAIGKEVKQAIHNALMTWKRREGSSTFGAYEMVLVNAYQDGLTDLSVKDFEAAVEAVFEEYKDQVYTYTRDLLRMLKAKGYVLLAISGSHQEIVDKLAGYYGFDDAVGQVFQIRDGHFTGEHTAPMLHKDRVLSDMIGKHRLATAGSVAVGDSEGDIAMLGLVEQPIAFNPSQGLFGHAKQHGWKVVLERKNMIYELESQHGQYLLAKTNA